MNLHYMCVCIPDNRTLHVNLFAVLHATHKHSSISLSQQSKHINKTKLASSYFHMFYADANAHLDVKCNVEAVIINAHFALLGRRDDAAAQRKLVASTTDRDAVAARRRQHGWQQLVVGGRVLLQMRDVCVDVVAANRRLAMVIAANEQVVFVTRQLVRALGRALLLIGEDLVERERKRLTRHCESGGFQCRSVSWHKNKQKIIKTKNKNITTFFLLCAL